MNIVIVLVHYLKEDKDNCYFKIFITLKSNRVFVFNLFRKKEEIVSKKANNYFR